MVTQQEELIKQLQANVYLAEGITVDMAAFQALEVHEKLESTEQDPFTKVEAIQNCYWVVELSLNNIYIKEREATADRANFEDSILIAAKDYIE